MAKYPKFTERIKENNWQLPKRTVAVVLVFASTMGAIFGSRALNKKLGEQKPDDLAQVETMGNDNVQKTEGATDKEFGKEEADTAYNTVVGTNPTNSDNSLIQNMINDPLSFSYIANGATVTKTYTFDTQNSIYTMDQTTEITLSSGKTFATKATTTGRFTLENGVIKIFENSGLNAGDVILGNQSQTSEQYSDILYVADDGCVYSTILGEAVPAFIDNQDIQDNQNTPTI